MGAPAMHLMRRRTRDAFSTLSENLDGKERPLAGALQVPVRYVFFVFAALLLLSSSVALHASHRTVSTPSTRAITWPVTALVMRPVECQYTSPCPSAPARRRWNAPKLLTLHRRCPTSELDMYEFGPPAARARRLKAQAVPPALG